MGLFTYEDRRGYTRMRAGAVTAAAVAVVAGLIFGIAMLIGAAWQPR